MKFNLDKITYENKNRNLFYIKFVTECYVIINFSAWHTESQKIHNNLWARVLNNSYENVILLELAQLFLLEKV
jgi:hypothetical protein